MCADRCCFCSCSFLFLFCVLISDLWAFSCNFVNCLYASLCHIPWASLSISFCTLHGVLVLDVYVHSVVEPSLSLSLFLLSWKWLLVPDFTRTCRRKSFGNLRNDWTISSRCDGERSFVVFSKHLFPCFRFTLCSFFVFVFSLFLSLCPIPSSFCFFSLRFACFF